MSFWKKIGKGIGNFLTGGAGAIIGGVSSLISGANANKTQREENEKNRQWNLEMAKLQNQWNIDQWNRENEYNSPINQVNRLKVAGLNPSLIGGASSGNASSMQMAGSAPSSPTDLSAGLSAKMQGIQLLTQAALNEAQIKNIKAQTRKTNEEANYQASENKVRDNLQHIFGDGSTIDSMMDSFTGDALTSRALAEIAGMHYNARMLKFQGSREQAESVISWINSGFQQKWKQLEQDLRSADVDIRKEEARTIVEKIALELAGKRSENVTKEFEAIVNDPSTLEQMPQILVQLARFFKWIMGK